MQAPDVADYRNTLGQAERITRGITLYDPVSRGDDIKADTCRFKCLKKCSYKYCISDRLNASCTGDVDNGLVFSGANTYKMKEILSVREIFDRFVKAAESVYKENVPGIAAAKPVAS